jgi:hypothetical protein
MGSRGNAAMKESIDDAVSGVVEPILWSAAAMAEGPQAKLQQHVHNGRKHYSQPKES